MRIVAPSSRRDEQSAVAGIHYMVTGDGPRTLVLLHGFCDNLTTWNRVVPPLAVSHRVIAIDLPGFGLSTRSWQPRLIEGYVGAVAEVLDAEGVREPVSFMGNSMGAVVSTAFAARYPERTDRVVLIDMPGLRGVPQLWKVAMSRPAELWLRTTMRVVGDRSARAGLSWAFNRVACSDPRRLDPSARGGFALPYTVQGSIPAVLPIGRALLGDLATMGLDTMVGDLAAPVLLVFGSRDLLTPARVLRRTGRAGGAVVIPRCGHCPQLDQPALLLAAAMPFLAHRGVGDPGRVGASPAA